MRGQKDPWLGPPPAPPPPPRTADGRLAVPRDRHKVAPWLSVGCRASRWAGLREETRRFPSCSRSALTPTCPSLGPVPGTSLGSWHQK